MGKNVHESHRRLISDFFVKLLRETTKICQDTRPLGFNSRPSEDEAGAPNRGFCSQDNNTLHGLYTRER